MWLADNFDLRTYCLMSTDCALSIVTYSVDSGVGVWRQHHEITIVLDADCIQYSWIQLIK
jgi:hypothetical protein